MARTYRKNPNQPTHKMAAEAKNPEGATAYIDMTGDPLARFDEIAEACGLPKRTVQILSERLRKRWVPVNDRVKQLRHKELLSLIEDRMLKSMDYMACEPC